MALSVDRDKIRSAAVASLKEGFCGKKSFVEKIFTLQKNLSFIDGNEKSLSVRLTVLVTFWLAGN